MRNDTIVAETGWVRPDVDTEPGTVAIWDVPLSRAAGEGSPTGAFAATVNFRGRVETGKNPQALALSGSGTTLLTANAGDGTVTVIDALSAEVERTIPLGGMPVGIGGDVDRPVAYVTRRDRDDVVVVSFVDGETVATIPVGMSPGQIVRSLDGRTLIVANTRDQTVTLIEAASYAVRAVVEVGPRPVGLLGLTSGEVLVCRPFAGEVLTLDPDGARITNRLSIDAGIGTLSRRDIHGSAPHLLTFKHGDVYHMNPQATELRGMIAAHHASEPTPDQVGF